MESSHQRFQRLTQALDTIVSLEAASIASGDPSELADIQRRAAPVVGAIAALAPEVRDAVSRARVASLLSRRQCNLDLIETQLATMRGEMDAVRASTGRLARLAPAYSSAGVYRKAGRLRTAV